MEPSFEDRIDEALYSLHVQKYPSIRQAAAAYSLSHRTLARRWNGAVSREEARQNEQILSPIQEEKLADWIVQLERRGHAPSHPQVRQMALRISTISGGPERIGCNWMARFLIRQPNIRSKIGRNMDALRVKGTERDALLSWFTAYDEAICGVDPLDIWNMDETGLHIGTTGNGRVLGSSTTKRTYVKTPGSSREWVTTIEAVSAAGYALQPLIIFKGKTLQSSWFESESIPDWTYTTSANAFTTNFIGLKWLKEVFLPHTARNPPRRRILIMDNQASHTSTDFLFECYQNDVYACFLLPHTSHACQPLDVCPFSQLKREYKSQVRHHAQFDDAGKIRKSEFLKFYKTARAVGLDTKYIKAGWRGAGLWPYNPSKVLNSSLLLPAAISEASTAIQMPQESHFSTPRNRTQLRESIDQLVAVEPLSRSARTLLKKVGKAVDIFNSEQASIGAQIAGQKRKLDSVQLQKGPKVSFNAQEAFANIDTIKEAKEKEKEAFERGEAYSKRQGRAMAQKTANQMAERDIEACTT
jgi:DDE superfamily endonuclease/Tc5 transposase DNA-binding domain